MKLDITITASVRADILRMTLHSFRKNLLNQFDARLIINVDPRGELETHTQMDMVEIAREYFDEVVERTPTVSSFPSAVRWCWEQVETEFFFHLEDDWILRRPVPAADLIGMFSDPQVSGVSLSRRTRRSFFRWLTRAGYEVREYDGDHLHYPTMTLNPGMFRAATVKPLIANFAPNLDPEHQLGKLRRHGDGIFLKRLKNPPIVIDTGTLWRKRRALYKSHAAEGETYASPTSQSRWREGVLTLRYRFWGWVWRVFYCR